MKQIYYGDWKEGGFHQMVADFSGIYMDRESYESDKPWPNEQMWRENKEKMTEALKDPRYDAQILFAAYTYEDYSGDAFVLFKRDGKLHEINGGHCSCYGLSESSYSGSSPDQWEPEETTKEALLHRLEHSSYGIFGQFKDEILAALED